MTKQSTPGSTNPYVGPDAFSRDDGKIFQGRDQEANRLLSLVTSERVVWFHAPSGAGKTSLVNKRLIPGLEERGYSVLPVARVGGNVHPDVSPNDIGNVFSYSILTYLYPEFAEKDARALASLSLPSGLSLFQSEGGERGEVLILDQFEEIVTAHEAFWTQREAFFIELRDSLNTNPTLSVVIVSRDDHVGSIEAFASIVPGRLRARFRMDKLRGKEALKALKEPAKAEGRPFQDPAAEELVRNLQRVRDETDGEFVEPVQLQVVCYRLWDNLTRKENKKRSNKPAALTQNTITLDDIRNHGNVDRALEDFYEDALKRVAQKVRMPPGDLRLRLGRDFLTPGGARKQVAEDELKEFENAANGFVDQHILRREEARGGKWYEIVHDRFVQPISRSNQRWLLRQGGDVLDSAREWDIQGRRSDSDELLRDDHEWFRATKWASANSKQIEDTPVADFLEASRNFIQERKHEARYVVLLLTQGIATVSALFVAWLMNLGLLGIYADKPFHNSWLFVGGAAVALIFLFSEPIVRQFKLPIQQKGLSVDQSIWWYFGADLVALSYLISYSGGLFVSPFSAFLVLLPTNGIILGQSVRTVSVYYFFVGIAGVGLTFLRVADRRILHEGAYQWAVVIIFLLVLLTFWQGYSRVHEQDIEESFTST